MTFTQGRVRRRREHFYLLVATALLIFFPSQGLFAQEQKSKSATDTQPSDSTQEIHTIDADAAPATPYRLTPYLKFGGRLEYEYQFEENFDVRDDVADELVTMEPKLSLALTLDPHPKFEAFLNMTLEREFVLEEKRPKENREWELKISQAYVTFKDWIEHLKVSFGRQRFNDDREWLYDQRLDALRLRYKFKDLRFEGGLAWEGVVDEDLLNDEQDNRVNDYLLRLTYKPADSFKIAPFLLYRHDFSKDKERPFFLGAQFSGKIQNLSYWWDTAYVRGTERRTSTRRGITTERKIRFAGIGLDVGAVYTFDVSLNPSLFFAYAFGSGDDEPGDRDHRGFRQTGLQDNSDKLGGVTSVKYYGELADPELNNLTIFTGGGGIQPFHNVSLEVLYHYYQQPHASAEVRDWEIDSDPSGTDGRLGHEVDFIFGIKNFYRFDVKTTFGLFLPGPAFPAEADNTAFFAELKTRYNF